jgi:hypothetical protein
MDATSAVYPARADLGACEHACRPGRLRTHPRDRAIKLCRRQPSKCAPEEASRSVGPFPCGREARVERGAALPECNKPISIEHHHERRVVRDLTVIAQVMRAYVLDEARVLWLRRQRLLVRWTRDDLPPRRDRCGRPRRRKRIRSGGLRIEPLRHMKPSEAELDRARARCSKPRLETQRTSCNHDPCGT